MVVNFTNRKINNNNNIEMQIQETLEKELTKRFKSNCIIETLKSQIEAKAEYKVYIKYDSLPIFKNRLVFKLKGVKAAYNTKFLNSMNKSNVQISVTYLCVSKLPKHKRDQLVKVTKEYEKNGWIDGFRRSKVPVFKEFRFTVSLDQVLNDGFNLAIE